MTKIACFFEYLTVLASSLLLFIVPYDRRLGRITFLCIVISIFLMRLFKFRGDLKQAVLILRKLNTTLLLVILACFLSIIFSLNPYHSQKIFFNRYLLYVLLIWSGYCLGLEFTRKKLVFIAVAFNCAALFMGLGGMWDYLRNFPIAGRLWTVWGISTPFNMLPLYLSFFFAFNFSFMLQWVNKPFRWFGLINLLFIVFFLVWQQCRSAYASVVAAMLFVGGLRGRKFFLGLFAVVLSIFAVAAFFSPPVKEHIGIYLDINKWDNRLPLYRAAVKIFRDYPVFGAGIGMFEKLIKDPRYALASDYSPGNMDMFIHAHSFYLETLAEMGVLGFTVLFMVFGIFFISLIIKLKSITDNILRPFLIGIGGALLIFLVFGVSATIITVGLNESGIFWLFFGLASGLIKRDYQ